MHLQQVAQTAIVLAVFFVLVLVTVTKPETPQNLSRLLNFTQKTPCCSQVPRAALIGEVFDISLTTPSKAAMRVHVLRYSSVGGALLYSWAEYAPQNLAVQSSTSRSLNGTYLGVDPSGLFWSAQVLLGGHQELWDKLRAMRKLPTQGIIVLFEQGQSLIDVNIVELRNSAEMGVRVRRFTSPFEGVLFEPIQSRPSQIVLMLGGSNDTLAVTTASNLASKGLTVFAARYVSKFGQSECFDAIEVSQFDRLAQWLRDSLARPKAKINVLGVSAGAQASLIIANQRYSWLSGIVAIVPSRWHFNGATGPLCSLSAAPWSIDGRNVAYLDFFPSTVEGWVIGVAVKLGLMKYRDSIQRVLTETDPSELLKYELDVSKISVPVLLFGAGQDEFIPSSESVERLCRAIRLPADQVNRVTCVTYADASHYISSWPGRREPCAKWKVADLMDLNTFRCHATMAAARDVWDKTADFLLSQPVADPIE